MSHDRTFFQKKYCDECIDIHWVEVQNPGDIPREKVICHGWNFFPVETKTHYVKSAGKGFYLIRKSKWWEPKPEPQPEPLPLAWQFAREARQPEEIDF